MAETLAAYSLVSAEVAARFLDCSPGQVRKLYRDGTLPGVRVGHALKFDPFTLAVHVLAEEARVSRDEYLRRHGEAAPEHARRYVTRVRKLQGEAA
jgi:hypothetical protein